MFSRQIQVPPLPARAAYKPVAPGALPSALPAADAGLEANLGYSERQRLTREREEAAETERRAQAVRAHLPIAACLATSWSMSGGQGGATTLRCDPWSNINGRHTLHCSGQFAW